MGYADSFGLQSKQGAIEVLSESVLEFEWRNLR